MKKQQKLRPSALTSAIGLNFRLISTIIFASSMLSKPAMADYIVQDEITVSAYAEGCGHTDQCQRRTDTQYLGIPNQCVRVSQRIIPGQVFGRIEGPRLTVLPRGSQISESQYQEMSSNSSFSANVSAGQYGNYGGSYASSLASRSNRGGGFITNVDIMRMQVEATGRRAFWRGPGSKGEYTLRVKMRCRNN